jgi:hypothetical protein
MFGLPATVTAPDVLGCLNWRWLPLVLAKYHLFLKQLNDLLHFHV